MHQRQLTTIYITHGHADHFLGLPVLLDRFPDARAVATAATVERMRSDTPQAPNAARARYPGQIADTIAVPEPVDNGHFELEGHRLDVIETGHTDTVDTTSLHVPDLDLIVSGDVAYNHCHMYVGATTPGSRAEWIAALDQLAALNPAAVVTGHKDPTQGNPPSVGRVPRLPRILRTAARSRPARTGAIRRHGEPLSRLGQPPAISATRHHGKCRRPAWAPRQPVRP